MSARKLRLPELGSTLSGDATVAAAVRDLAAGAKIGDRIDTNEYRAWICADAVLCVAAEAGGLVAPRSASAALHLGLAARGLRLWGTDRGFICVARRLLDRVRCHGRDDPSTSEEPCEEPATHVVFRRRARALNMCRDCAEDAAEALGSTFCARPPKSVRP